MPKWQPLTTTTWLIGADLISVQHIIRAVVVATPLLLFN